MALNSFGEPMLELEQRDVVVFEPDEIEELDLGEMGERVIDCKIIVLDNLNGHFSIEAVNSEGFEISIRLTDAEAESICKFILGQLHFGGRN